MQVSEEILGQTRAFMQSRIIITAAELDLFNLFQDSPQDSEMMAQSIGVDKRALSRILDCLVGIGLFQKKEGVYSITAKGAYLTSDHPESILPMVHHLNKLWDSWSNLTETVKNGQNNELEPLTKDQKTCQDFIGAMAVVGRELAQELARDYDCNGLSRLLDIGGASGTYTIAFLKENPGLKATIFDLPQVIPIAEKSIAKAGLQDRVDFAKGDFYKDDLPKGHDFALLSAIIHQNSPAENLDLFKKVHLALKKKGIILIRDHIMDEHRIEPKAGALFAVNMLVNTPGGDTYTFSECKELLQQAGFCKVELVRKGKNMDCLIQAQKD